MHETIIAKKILKQARKKAGGKKIISITLEVGELAHLPAEDFREVISSIADFKVNVRQTKANVECSCGFKGAPKIIAHEHDFVLFECPRCKKTPKILKGKDIVLKEIKTA